MRTRLWRFHLGGGCALALVYAYLPYPPLRIGAMVVLCLATIAATLAAIRLWRPARRAPFPLFAAGEAVGFAAGAFGSSAAVTRAGGNVAAAALTCVVYLIGIVGYALLIRTRSPGRDRASLIDATVISTGVGMLAWVFLAAPYSADTSLPLVERVLSIPTSRSWTAWRGGRGVGGGPGHHRPGRDPVPGHRGRGVEHAEQAAALAELGCHLAQSYHFSRPVPAADMSHLAGQRPVAGLSHPA